VWQWVEHLRATCPSWKRLVLLNMDETGIPMFMGDQQGNVPARSKATASFQPRGREPTQHVTRQQLRGQLTHAALICDDAALQPLLPQVLIGDHSMLQARVQRAIADRVPANVTVLRLKSRWMDAPLLQAILRALGQALRGHPDRHPVLLLDCCPCHLQEPVLRTARACGIQLCFIPAKLTWLLQPCDTHVFQQYKATLREGYAKLRRNSADGTVDQETWWAFVSEHAGRYMGSRDWSSAFAATGYSAGMHGVSSYIKKQLELECLPPIAAGPPSTEQLDALLPAKRSLHWHLILRQPPRPARLVGSVAAKASGASALQALGDTINEHGRRLGTEAPARQPSPSPWRIPRAMPLPPLPPPAAPPPSRRITKSMSAAEQQATATAVQEETASQSRKRARAGPTMAGSSTDPCPEPISARTRSRTFEHATSS
jgi:hypothetical protein